MGESSLNPLNYEHKGSRGTVRLNRRHIALFVLLAIGAGGWGLSQAFKPRLIVCRESGTRVKCASNLRQIGLGMQMYANENHGQLPPDLGTVLVTQDLTSEVFVCPASGDERASGPTTQALLQDLQQPGHCSYVYASPLPATWSALTKDHVLVYELPANHLNDGMNILFGDGHAEYVVKPQAHYIVSELKAGFNPPRKRGTTRSNQPLPAGTAHD